MFDAQLDDTLRMRPPAGRHAADLAAAATEALVPLARWLPAAAALVHPEAARAWLIERGRDLADDRGFAATIWLSEPAGGAARLVGVVATNKLDWPNLKTQLEFWLTPAAEGCGIMSRCLTACMRHLFHERGLHRATVRCATDHPRVRPLVERLGFVHEGVIRECILRDGQWIDDDLFGLLATHWRSVR